MKSTPRSVKQSAQVEGMATSPRSRAQADTLARWTGPPVAQLLNSKDKKLLDPIKDTVVNAASDIARWTLIKKALDAKQAGTDQNVIDGAKYLKVNVVKPVLVPVLPVGPVTPFKSLQDDVKQGLYAVTTGVAKIRTPSGESEFMNYTKGAATVDDAVMQAIDGLDLTGSISFKFSRHDFQPTSSKFNLQVQLGGAASYRVGKGDTSSTLVVVDPTLWNTLKADPPRLKLILQAAHVQSFANIEKVELGPA